MVTLRISGGSLEPKEICDALGAQPSRAHRKGERISKSSAWDAPRGQWHLRATDQVPANVNIQVVEIFGKLTSDVSIWNRIATENKIDLIVGLFLTETNQGVELSTRSLALISERGVKLGLDIYGADYDVGAGDA
jgi:hypothetical protein